MAPEDTKRKTEDPRATARDSDRTTKAAVEAENRVETNGIAGEGTPGERAEPNSQVIPYEEFLAARKRREGEVPESAEPGADSVEALRRSILSIPEVREEKVRQVRERIEQGFYDRPEILQQIAARMAAFFAPGERPRKPESAE